MFIKLLFLMLSSHCFADTILQIPSIGYGKNRHKEIDLSRVPKGQKPVNIWYIWLTHHAIIHGFTLALILKIFGFGQFWWVGILETFTHWIIDFFKCDNVYGQRMDQALHLLMKVLYIGIIVLK